MVILRAVLVLAGAAVFSTTTAVAPEVLKLREAAWRAYFAGDDAGLGAMLSPDFIGMNMLDGPFVTRDQALEQCRSIRASGARLVSLEFPETRAQRYGDVVILYGRYRAVVESGGPESKTSSMSGRLTELFLRKDGRWIHTGWHLDTTSTP